ncbi:conserved hypothetical protein [Talaromyces stipitatus ATCC 10500]|uniref:C6 transcription factor n=1 Tax=Talaromyces stipitatus (strain ATCC 10500 / CBS 375.48 / QM 6759 / NRRL 1006) TaxID=441959 RepID=B8LZT3_TALSN|nr:uncharacterized protein TSTA_080980 [Talaromyces stipitatus ATCC 10500]EED20865.1 conserved hypothetical protein [Talaromyces stipitatus ATCC 10500]
MFDMQVRKTSGSSHMIIDEQYGPARHEWYKTVAVLTKNFFVGYDIRNAMRLVPLAEDVLALGARTRSTKTAVTAVETTLDKVYPLSVTLAGSERISTPVGLTDASQIELVWRERWYLEFFRNNTALQCSGFFMHDFWQRLVYQISEEEPAVRHASIALGALHWNFERSKTGQGEPDPVFPLQQCNKAIACLRLQLHSTSRPYRAHMETGLVTCLLFVVLAFLQGDAHTARRHLQSGHIMLREWQNTVSEENSEIKSTLVKAFAHMQLHWSTVAEPETSTGEDDMDTDDGYIPLSNFGLSETIDSLEKAGNLLVGLGWIVLQAHPQLSASTKANNLLKYERSTILTKLQRWMTELTYSLVRRGDVLMPRDRATLMVLELWSEIIYIKASTWSETNERVFDKFYSNFQRAVQIAKELLTSNSTRSPLPTFSVGTGIIPPLFFCASKCRDWVLRREALLLLRGWQLQEGIWKTSLTAQILEQLIQIESEGFLPEDVIPESARIASMHVEILHEDQKVRLWYRRSAHFEKRYIQLLSNP